MKNIDDVKRDILDIKLRVDQINELEKSRKDITEEKKLRKRVPFLNKCILYLETNPNEQFLIDEIKKLEFKINNRMALFVLDGADFKPKTFVSKMKKAHEKQYEIPKFREQIRTMRYLLK